MPKSVKIVVAIEPELREQLNAKSLETGVPVAEVARRAWAVWLETGVLPKVKTRKK